MTANSPTHILSCCESRKLAYVFVEELLSTHRLENSLSLWRQTCAGRL